MHEINCQLPRYSLYDGIQNDNTSTVGDTSLNSYYNPVPNSNEIQAVHRNISEFNVSAIKCWNCGSGHRFQDCDIPIKSIFCFGCGKKDTVKPHCPICTSKNQGNRSEGMRLSGNHHSFQTNPPQPRPSTHEAAANTDPELYQRNIQILKRTK